MIELNDTLKEQVEKQNIHRATIDGFGEEWNYFDQKQLKKDEHATIFDDYFHLFPWHLFSDATGVGMDVGCGTGRWAKLVAPRVKKLFVLDASEKALKVAKLNLLHHHNVEFLCQPVSNEMFTENALDFAYSLGVLHHIPDTQLALMSIAHVLKPGAPFLVYLYYDFDNRPMFYRFLWQCSDKMRKFLSKRSFFVRLFCSQLVALCMYWPLARIAKVLDKIHLLPSAWPLSYYRDKSFYVMRTDSFDRLCTQLEQRFSRKDIQIMLEKAGFEKIRFSEKSPYWCAVAFKRAANVA